MNSSPLRVLSQNFQQLLGRFRVDAPVRMETVRDQVKERVVTSATRLNDHYTRFLGLDEVKRYQDRVVSLQERLLEAQEARRDASLRLSQIRQKSHELQDEVHKVKRRDDIDRFLQLMKDETELLRKERELDELFERTDRYERDLFAAYVNAVRDSHEKQRAQLEYTKYFGIILSITGSFLAFCYSSFRKQDLKHLLEKGVTKEDLMPLLDRTLTKDDVTALFQKANNDGLMTKIQKLLSEQRQEKSEPSVTGVVSQNDRTNVRQIVYYMGLGALLVVVLKLMSG